MVLGDQRRRILEISEEHPWVRTCSYDMEKSELEESRCDDTNFQMDIDDYKSKLGIWFLMN